MRRAIISSAIVLSFTIGSIYYQPLLYFMVGYSSIKVFSIFTLGVLDKKALLKLYKGGSHLPAWADAVFYISMVLLFLASGSWVTAVMWFLIGSVDFELRKEVADDMAVE